MTRETGSGLAEERGRVEDGPAATLTPFRVLGRKVELAVHFAEGDEVFASGTNIFNSSFDLI